MKQREWIWADTAVHGVRLLWCLLIVYFSYIAHGHRLVPWWETVWMFAWFVLPVWWWRPRRMDAVRFGVLELLLGGSLHVHTMINVGGYDNSFVISLMMIGYTAASRRTFGWTALGAVACELLPLIVPSFTLRDALQALLQAGLFYGIGYCFNRMHAQNTLLTQYARQIEQLTLLQERNRLAHDLHDTVGHTMISVVMGLDVSIQVVDDDPNAAKAMLQDLRDVARDGLDEIRTQIHQIAPADEDRLLSLQLREVLEEFASVTSTRISFDIDGPEPPLPRPLKLAFLRGLQESLTNAKKHGEATHIRIRLTFADGEVTLRIADNGKGTEMRSPGFGLRGMHERMEALRGTIRISANSNAGGVEVILQVPWKEEVS